MISRRTTLTTAGITVILALAFAPGVFGAPRPVLPPSAQPKDFMPSTSCSCHSALVVQWSASMHSVAYSDPVFQVKVRQADEQVGTAVGDFCRTCHTPVAAMTGELGGSMSPASAESVTCMFCHQVTGLDGGTIANVSQLVDPSLVRRAQLEDSIAPHAVENSEFHTSAEICGGCHNVQHPSTGTHLEATYTEWAASPYAADGVVCQDCHMNADPGGVIGPSSGTAAIPTRRRNDIYQMTFHGANAGQGDAYAAKALLESAAKVTMEAPEILPPGEETSVTVTIENVGAGHYLPTGITEVRQMWLEVYAEAPDGTRTEVGERRFGTEVKDAAGEHPVEMWFAAGIHSDDRIPPKGSVTADYRFTMPEEAEQSRLVAALNYRSLPEELAEEAGVENPTTEMASAEQVLYGSAEARTRGPADATAGEGGAPANSIWVWALVLVAAIIIALVAVYNVRRRRSA